VERLRGAAELYVGAHCYRVVALGERIQHLQHGDGQVRRPAVGEVVALEDAGYRGGGRELEELLHREARQPLAVGAHLQLLGIPIEDQEGLLLVGERVGVDARRIETWSGL